MSTGFVLEIDELVIDGVAPSDGGLVAIALRRELERLVALHGIPSGLVTSGDRAALEIGSAGISRGDGATTLGAKAGRALYGALSR